MYQPPSQPTSQPTAQTPSLPPATPALEDYSKRSAIDPYAAEPYSGERPSYYIRLAPPTVTYVFIALNLIAFVAEIIWGIVEYQDWNGSQNINVLVDLGAKVNEYIALQGHYWRLFSAMFLHIGILHLLFNLYALYAVGAMVESYYGHWRYTVIYLLGGLFGSLGSYAFSESVSAGASGAIFAVTGAAAAYFFMYRENFGSHGRAVLQNIVIVIAVNMAFGIAGQGVDNWGHFGGLIGGLVLGFGLAPRYERDPWGMLAPGSPQPLTVRSRPAVEIGVIVLTIVLFAAGTYWRSGQIITQNLPILGL